VKLLCNCKMDNKNLFDFIRQGINELLGYDPSPAATEFFLFYAQELIRWNKVHNLTAITQEKDIVVKHFFDSLTYLKVMPSSAGRLIDIGAGAGFPGIPVKAVNPEISLTLVESHTKKCSFLRHLVRQSDLLKGTEIINKRVEDIPKDEQFDAAVTRALFSLKEFADKAEGLIKPGGCLIVSKGPAVGKELKRIHNYETVNLSLPFVDIKRHMVIMKKSKCQTDCKAHFSGNV
jgi:16S rRNA (guanine527-N7)-methyltransferase